MPTSGGSLPALRRSSPPATPDRDAPHCRPFGRPDSAGQGNTLAEMIRFRQRYRDPFCLLLPDVGQSKEINDTSATPGGRPLLQAATKAQKLMQQHSWRPRRPKASWHGEMPPGTGPRKAAAMACSSPRHRRWRRQPQPATLPDVKPFRFALPRLQRNGIPPLVPLARRPDAPWNPAKRGTGIFPLCSVLLSLIMVQRPRPCHQLPTPTARRRTIESCIFT